MKMSTSMNYMRLRPAVPDSCSSSAAVFEALADDVADYTPDCKVIKEFYATAIEPESGRLVTEDYQFCRLARSHGFKIYAPLGAFKPCRNIYI